MKQLIKFVIFILIIYLIYLIYNHLKNTEENFQNIIEVHFQEQQQQEQTLYKIDLSSSNPITIDGTIPYIDVKNIIALFPISDTTIYMLDSTHQLFKVEITSSSASSEQISFSNTEYPVKVVGNSYVVYVLTSKGNVYTINDDRSLTLQQSINAIDIALTSSGTLYSLNKQGILSSPVSTTDTTYSSSKFIQIICSGDTVFGLSTDKNIYDITNNRPLTSTLLNPINIQLISSDSMFGYIDDSNTFYFMLNNDTDTLSNSHNNVKQASFNESETETGTTTYHRRIVLDTNDQIKISNTANGNLEPITIRKGNDLNIQLFAGVNMNNIFVLADRQTGPVLIPRTTEQQPPEITPIVNCPDCNICTETTFNDCDSIFVAIKGLIDPSSTNCDS